MLVYAGIDEAGYGPMLGPLCIGATAFVLDGPVPDRGAPNLWSTLKGAVCRTRRDRRGRLAVADSKKLKGSRPKAGADGPHPLRHLERAVLAFIATETELPADDDALLARLGVAVADRPWYRTTTPLPVGQEPDELRIAASRLRRAMASAGVTCPLIRCTAIDAGAFNDSVAAQGNKATVNLAAALDLVDEIWRRWPDDHPRIIVDRHGGRTRYAGALARRFVGASVVTVAESEEVSRYRLTHQGAELTISFAPASEDRHLPAALASMTAKYVRELLMLRLNRFFTGHMPELKPTAGYVQDARRYLRDIEPLLDDLDLPRRELVRAV